jgi:hypothetical protein
MQLASDLFTEMIFLDLDPTKGQFWIILIFDVAMLIARDADLWEDLAVWLYKQYGQCGVCLSVLLQFMGGDGDDVGGEWVRSAAILIQNYTLIDLCLSEMATKNLEEKSRVRAITNAVGITAYAGASAEERDPKVQALVRKSLTENCIISEMLASFVLFVVVGTEELMDRYKVSGIQAPSVSINPDSYRSIHFAPCIMYIH